MSRFNKTSKPGKLQQAIVAVIVAGAVLFTSLAWAGEDALRPVAAKERIIEIKKTAGHPNPTLSGLYKFIRYGPRRLMAKLTRKYERVAKKLDFKKGTEEFALVVQLGMKMEGKGMRLYYDRREVFLETIEFATYYSCHSEKEARICLKLAIKLVEASEELWDIHTFLYWVIPEVTGTAEKPIESQADFLRILGNVRNKRNLELSGIELEILTTPAMVTEDGTGRKVPNPAYSKLEKDKKRLEDYINYLGRIISMLAGAEPKAGPNFVPREGRSAIESSV